jgi:glycosyltransferase involved in cell wall biosynthesis
MRPQLHYHTDCAYFAGCENMLPAFFASDDLRNRYDITFSYRFSERYTQGFQQRVKADFPIYPLSFPDILDASLLPSSLPFLLRRIIFFAQRLLGFFPLLIYEIWAFYRLMRKVKPKIVHINNGGYPAALSARAAGIGAKIANVPSVLMVVNNMAVGYDHWYRWLDYPIDRIVVHSVDKFVTGSGAACNRVGRVLGLPEDKAISIHHGIAYQCPTSTRTATLKFLGLDRFEGVVFGIVGVLGPRKGHKVLLEAAVRLTQLRREGMPLFKIVVVGDGYLRGNLEEFVRGNGLSEYCIFTGERSDVMNYMGILDALVFSSTEAEDFPFVILEAMSHGKPVIASKVGGTIEQVVDGKTGLLVDPGDVAQLVSAMYKVASCPELRKEMGAAGRKYFLDHFASEIAVGKYLSLYESMLS